jgi:hypothetical protein
VLFFVYCVVCEGLRVLFSFFPLCVGRQESVVGLERCVGGGNGG